MSTNSIPFDYVLCSRRLKELRQEKHISHQALADTIGVSKQVVINYEVAANNGGVVTNSPSDKTLSVAGMKIETLYKLAEYYNVSTDYLLGRTDVKTPDTELKTVCEVTNLSESAVNRIIEFSSKKSYRAYTDLLSLFIENPNMEYFLNLLEGYITSGNDTDDKQLGMSRFNYSTKDVALLAINNTIKLMLSQITIPFLSNCTPTEILLIKVILPRLKEDYQTAIQNNKMTPEEAENKISDLENEIEELNKKYQSIIQELKNGGSNNG